MIVNMNHNILVVYDRRYNLSEFRHASKVVPGTYAEELVDRLHHCLFVYPKDVRAEYLKYYEIEYQDFGQFLRWKYALGFDVLDQVIKRIERGASYIGYGRDSIWMLEDDTLIAVLDQVLSELGEKVYEDSN